RLARTFRVGSGPWVYHRDSYWRYEGTRYRQVAAKEVEALLREHLEQEFTGQEKPVTTKLLANALSSLKALVLVEGEREMPFDLRGGGPGTLIPCANGLLDPSTRTLAAHGEHWFCGYCLPYAYDPGADCPGWEAFLRDTFEGDAERILLLQSWFGY